jgi:nucleotide-binding universal stress UspA family protein
MVRIKKILCPIDFSAFSRRAFDRAVAIAKGHGASVSATHIVSTQAGPLFPYMEPGAVEAIVLSEADRERLMSELRRFLSIDESVRFPIDCEVIEAPSVYREILLQADRISADLIVMGTHGRSGFQRLVLGSTTEKVLRTPRPPVLTVGAAPDVAPADGSSFKQILCGFDFSDCSIRSLALCGVAGRASRRAAGRALRGRMDPNRIRPAG